jgi:soluble lytic murein transglycosylase-like protein
VIYLRRVLRSLGGVSRPRRARPGADRRSGSAAGSAVGFRGRAAALGRRLGIDLDRPEAVRRAAAMVSAVALVALASLGSGPDAATAGRSALAPAEVRSQVLRELELGERAVLEDRIARLDRIISYSSRYGVPADLATQIFDAAVVEGIDPALAFALVHVESSFRPRVVSSMGAVGLTQVLPSTAVGVEPGLRRGDLFRQGTNLRVGFRYLRALIDRYDGDLRMALLAYNRGPTRVDSLQRRGVDPANGYARAVLRSAAP